MQFSEHRNRDTNFKLGKKLLYRVCLLYILLLLFVLGEVGSGEASVLGSYSQGDSVRGVCPTSFVRIV